MTPHLRRAAVLPPLTFALGLALSGCDAAEERLTSPDGRFTLAFAADAKWKQELGRAEMESALALHDDIAVVYAHNDPMARGAQLAAEQAGRTGIVFLGIDALPHEGVRYVAEGKLDATFTYPTGGVEAVDLALLALNGVELPKDITLGTRMFTAQNVADGGEAIDATGAAQLAALRSAHGEHLAAALTEQIWRVGMSQCTLDEPWRVQMNQDVRDAVARYPQLELVEKDAQDDSERQRNQIDELIAEEVNVILVSPKEEIALVPAVDRAMAAGIPVLVLDRRLGGDNYTCFLGGDNEAIGRAAGSFVDRTLANGGKIVEIRGLMTSSPAQDRHRGFVQALGLEGESR